MQQGFTAEKYCKDNVIFGNKSYKNLHFVKYYGII